MSRLTSSAAVLAVALATSLLTGGAASAEPASCTPTGFMRGTINMTAAQIGGDVTGPLDATGCNIGVYYDNTTSGNVTDADISGANYFGVVVNGDVGSATVNVTNSAIRKIGEFPPNGSQHGVAVYYRAFGGSADGIVSGNSITEYQKGGIVVNGAVSATIVKNTVTGLGVVPFIAQNGIQVAYGAKASVTENTVTGNAYSGPNSASSAGILVVGGEYFGAGLAETTGLNIKKNTLVGNDVGVFIFNADSSGNAPTFKTDNSVKLNTVSNDAVTNTTGWTASPACGYQAGIANNGFKDLIVNNSITGLGYTPTTGGDCTGSSPAYLRFLDLTSPAGGMASNK